MRATALVRVCVLVGGRDRMANNVTAAFHRAICAFLDARNERLSEDNHVSKATKSRICVCVWRRLELDYFDCFLLVGWL